MGESEALPCSTKIEEREVKRLKFNPLCVFVTVCVCFLFNI